MSTTAKTFSYEDEVHKLRASYEMINAQGWGMVAVALAIVATGMVAAWGQNNDASQKGYLGKPNWANNPYPYHPILMVGGFFLAQVLAVTSWSFIPGDKLLAKTFHVFLMIASIFCLFIAFAAVYKNYEKKDTQSATTMHSWIGFMTIFLFCLNFVWGFLMAFLTNFAPNSKFRAAISWLPIHKIVGSSTFFFTVISIITGIMDQLPYGSCFYPSSSSPNISNPAANYDQLPTGCQIGNGVGICVALCSIAFFVSIYYRAHSLGKWA